VAVRIAARQRLSEAEILDLRFGQVKAVGDLPGGEQPDWEDQLAGTDPVADDVLASCCVCICQAWIRRPRKALLPLGFNSGSTRCEAIYAVSGGHAGRQVTRVVRSSRISPESSDNRSPGRQRA
jgi:hypothetical protein